MKQMMKNGIRSTLLYVALMAMMLLASCKDHIDESARYVFRERTIASYLDNHPQFSEYTRLLHEQKVSSLSETTMYQLMTAYGYYTCFAPTNEAIQLFLDSLVRKGVLPEASWEAFPTERARDSIRSILVMNSIIDGTVQDKVFWTADFPKNNEEFSINTMADRKIFVTYEPKNPDICYIDGECQVDTRNRDIEAINGLIHEIDNVINPSNETIGSTLHTMAVTPDCGMHIIGKLVEACGLIDTLSQVKDEVYERLMKTRAIEPTFNNVASHFHNVPRPEHRKYGFTIFGETDEFWQNTFGKDAKDITTDDVKDWVVHQGFYPDALDNGDYTSADNVLNQFVTYHLLPMRLPADKLVIHYNEKGYNYKITNMQPTVPVWAHYVTMGKRRLLRLWESRESDGIYLNRFPVLDNSRHGTYHELSCSEENEGILIDVKENDRSIKLVNGIIYPIDKLLVYDSHVRGELKKQRLRYDIFDFTEEMINNDMRNMGYGASRSFTSDTEYKYFNNLWVNTRETFFYMLNGWGSDWPNYQADEVCTEGIYDCTWKVPPVPISGIYEIRMGVSTESAWRGICQIYFGTDRNALVPTGIPVDMALGGQKRNIDGAIFPSNVGWIPDTDDDDYNAEVDKRMRNNGFMKGPEYIVENPGSSVTNRMQEKSTRRIIVRQYMDADKEYYLRFKSVQDLYSKQLFLDYMEWCPKEIFDNPEEPEDIW